MSIELKRRELFKFAAGTAIAASALRAQDPHKFFTADEFAIVDAFTEILIPQDEKSGGAHAAKVTDYLDQEVSEAFDDEMRVKTRAGIALIDQLSMKMNGVGFVAASPKQRLDVVLKMSANEKAPKTPEEMLFGEIKGAAGRAYYTSKIGIEDQDYKGNVVQMRDYSGELPVGPALADPEPK